MERIASFSIDHMNLFPGLYVSRRDCKENCVITSFDMRITAPNREPVIDMPALHTIEHLGATFLRNSEQKDSIVYFGPMGCRTGCYLVMFGDLSCNNRSMGTETLIETFITLQQKLLRVARRILRGEMEAEDAVQDTFCNLWASSEPQAPIEAGN